MSKTMKFNQAFICSECSTIYPVDISFRFEAIDHTPKIILGNNRMIKLCTTCKTMKMHYLVDAKIADIVRLFNLIGYRTIFSCEGHVHKFNDGKYGVVPAYVMIEGNKKPTKKLIENLIKSGWNSFSTGRGKNFHKKIDFYNDKDVELLMNSKTFSVYYNLNAQFCFKSKTRKAAEEYLKIIRQSLYDVLIKYYNDICKRRKNNDSRI